MIRAARFPLLTPEYFFENPFDVIPIQRRGGMKVIFDTISEITLGDEKSHGNLTMIPILSESDFEPDYLTLDEALNQKVAKITEVSASGSVPELRFQNLGNTPILLLDGEELVGAKQNRILNLTILVPEKTTLIIPVSCVEAGRWSYGSDRSESESFDSSDRTFFAQGRAMKMKQVSLSLKERGSYQSDQSAIWEKIDTVAKSLDADSPTSEVGYVYEKHFEKLQEYIDVFPIGKNQIGALFGISGGVVGFDLVDSHLTFQKLMKKLVKSFALDAIRDTGEQDNVSLKEDAAKFLYLVKKAKAEKYPAIGRGDTIRLGGDEINGGALVVDDRIIHLSAFPCLNNEKNNEPAD